MRLLIAVASLLPMVAAQAASPPLAPGRYEAQLCTASGGAAHLSCGQAELDVRKDGRVDVRVADIVYRLTLRSSQLDALTMQGTMQIDAFSAVYDWDGTRLSFRDADKGVAYEVRAGARMKSH